MGYQSWKDYDEQESTRRGFATDPCCKCSPRHIEDLDHLFRYRSKVRPLWIQIDDDNRLKVANVEFIILNKIYIYIYNENI